MDLNEVYKIMHKLKLKKGGVDNINVKTLIGLIDFIAEPLTYIINLCIETSIWPGPLKKADITPVHKANKKCMASNYRQISLISNLAKILKELRKSDPLQAITFFTY